MSINNFKELERQQEKVYGSPPEKLRKNLFETINLFRFAGEIIELFLPRIFTLLVRMSGGSARQNVSGKGEKEEHKTGKGRPKYPNTDS